ncbi:MAG: PilZ domain-containing protein [Acidobacteriota bacterium]
MEWNLPERRTAPRLPIAGRLVAKVKAYLAARVVDISANGIQVELSHSMQPKTACDLRFPKGEGEVLLRAEVRRCRVWGMGDDEKGHRVLLYRAGLEFQDPPAIVLAKLAEVIPQIPSPSPPSAGKGAPEPSVTVLIEPKD